MGRGQLLSDVRRQQQDKGHCDKQDENKSLHGCTLLSPFAPCRRSGQRVAAQKMYTLIPLDFQGKAGVPRPSRTYPELFALMGGRVPDLRGRVTWGDSVPGKKIEAGLPEIRGSAPSMTFSNTHIDGAFVVSSYGNGFSLYSVPYGEPQQGHADFSASRSSPVYGRSTTVQPPSYTVRYLVRARP